MWGVQVRSEGIVGWEGFCKCFCFLQWKFVRMRFQIEWVLALFAGASSEPAGATRGVSSTRCGCSSALSASEASPRPSTKWAKTKEKQGAYHGRRNQKAIPKNKIGFKGLGVGERVKLGCGKYSLQGEISNIGAFMTLWPATSATSPTSL